MEENLTKRKVYHLIEKVFKPSNDQQKNSWRNDKNISTWNELLRNAAFEELENYDQITQRKNNVSADLGSSVAVDSSNTSILANLWNFLTKACFWRQLIGCKLEMKTHNPRKVIMKRSLKTFDVHGNERISCNLNNQDFRYFLSSTK